MEPVIEAYLLLIAPMRLDNISEHTVVCAHLFICCMASSCSIFPVARMDFSIRVNINLQQP